MINLKIHFAQIPFIMGSNRVAIGGTQVSLLLYADDIVLLSESEHDLQKHLNALDVFCTQRGLVVNLAKTKVLIFHTSPRVRSKCHLVLSHKPVEVVGS